jgi:hypothetical protein
MLQAVLSGLALAIAFTSIPVVYERIEARRQSVPPPSIRRYLLLGVVFAVLLVSIQIEAYLF